MSIATPHLNEFNFPAHMVKRYISNLELFTLLLTDGTIVQYIAPDAAIFKSWLVRNNIPDVRQIECARAEQTAT